MTEDEFDEEAYESEINSPAFKHGMDVGHSLGLYEASSEAIRAAEAGEIEYWLDWQRPKGFEEWREWYEKHDTTHDALKKRWGPPETL